MGGLGLNKLPQYSDIQKVDMFLSVFRKWLLFFFVSVLGGGFLFAGGLKDFPEVFVASYDAGNGVARLVVDWNKVPSDDDRQFGLYRSIGESADSYILVMTLDTNTSMYTDSGLNVDTEYHYIIGGALPRKTLPESKRRGKKELRTELATPRATLSYGNAPGSPIAWIPPGESSGEPPAHADPVAEALPLPPQSDGSPSPAAQTGGNRSPEAASPPSYESMGYYTVPERELTGGNNGVFFTMGYFSNRVFQLTGQINEPAMVNLVDSNAKSRLLSLFRQSYVRSSSPGTSLYYAIHNAVNQINRWEANGALSDFDSVLLVTITDGLDTASTDPALSPVDGIGFKNTLSYQYFIQNILEGGPAKERKLTAVSIGIRAADPLSEQEYRTTLRAAANGEDNVYRVPLHTLTKTLQDLAVSVTKGMAVQPFGFVTPAYPNGTEIFIALDGFSTPQRALNFISGQVKVQGEQFILENVTLGGFAKDATPTGTIIGQTGPNGGVEWRFTFPEALNPSRVIHYYKPGKDWQGSKEFALRVYPPASSHRSSLVYLLIDNSVSMSNQNIAAVRESVVKFIEALSVLPTQVQPVFSSDVSLSMTQFPERAAEPQLAAVPPPPPATSAAEPVKSVTETEPVRSPPETEPVRSPPETEPDPARNVSPPQVPDNKPTVPAATAVPQPVTGDKGYWVQASSSDNKTTAEEIIAQLRQYQLTPVIAEARVRGKIFYRVRIGPYASLADASTVADFVKQPPLGFYDSFVP
ncbi:MAG: SPOR domain-containing protein [Spirochaetaceae bacterium]|jgi:hypothetical protein|nr:SPOR domain-containing protein [Spirochaetaceae bacterium]